VRARACLRGGNRARLLLVLTAAEPVIARGGGMQTMDPTALTPGLGPLSWAGSRLHWPLT
jgi:hypothetical protein